jgi:hypothetical protein
VGFSFEGRAGRSMNVEMGTRISKEATTVFAGAFTIIQHMFLCMSAKCMSGLLFSMRKCLQRAHVSHIYTIHVFLTNVPSTFPY